MTMVFDLSAEYAEKALKAMDQATAQEVARALQKTLRRKLGYDTSAAPTFDVDDESIKAEQRFELFFDQLFTIAPANLDIPLSNAELRARVAEAHKMLLAEAKKVKGSKKWGDLESLYRDDASAYATMLDMIDREDIGRAIKRWSDMDTAARDWMFTGEDKVVLHRTALALGVDMI